MVNDRARVTKARYYTPLHGGDVQCTACDRRCVIAEGKSGVCGVRKNISGNLYLLVYGRVVDAYGDYIEKKKLCHFLPGSMAFSIGTVGCNFACDFCLNWQISQMPRLLKERGPGHVEAGGNGVGDFGYVLSPEEVVSYCKRRGYRIIAFTYNEPTVFLEYALDVARLAKKEGIFSVFVTNGYCSEEAVDELSQEMDAVSIDLKSFSGNFYRKHCKSSLDPVLRNIKRFFENGVWMELTTLIIPGENDRISELTHIADFILSLSNRIPWHITQFSPDYKLLDKRQTPPETLYRTYEMAKSKGLQYVYFGNLWDEEKTSTFCPSCGKLLVHRDIYSISMTEAFSSRGTCKACGEVIPGVWSHKGNMIAKRNA
ncbi:MAG: AmmeMemoRadiSam system radical SAM enzyme [Candidatus Dojkabacteria bacterium]|nr:AmmeMemoRadiSam system radical SAM enzyme [Candidatus Dojkabacteria bacterium]